MQQLDPLLSSPLRSTRIGRTWGVAKILAGLRSLIASDDSCRQGALPRTVIGGGDRALGDNPPCCAVATVWEAQIRGCDRRNSAKALRVVSET
jgi:hypothetical protein